VKGLKITTVGLKIYEPEIIEKKDPRGNSYYWLSRAIPAPKAVRTATSSPCNRAMSRCPRSTPIRPTALRSGSRFLRGLAAAIGRR